MTTANSDVRDILDFISEDNPRAITYDGLDNAIIGWTFASHDDDHSVLVYSRDKIIRIFMERDDMSYDDAMEFFDYNVLGLSLGEHQPVIIWDIKGL
jgi:hypothetical protein